MEAISTKTDQRINSIDTLRGIVMIIMVLDHARDYFSSINYDPLDLNKTSVLLFMTRWITHFCAPTFLFLSGTSAFLSLSKKSHKEASLTLLKRGVWLIFMELTILNFGWQFDPGFHLIFLQVIWAIGWSMILLSGLIFLHPKYILWIGLVIIFGHNTLDQLPASSFGRSSYLWMLLHESGIYKINNYESIFVLYPLIPWIGVMAVGYAFGTLFKYPPAFRVPLFIKIGLGCLVLFILLRFFNFYGDPFPWQLQDVWWKSILDFIKCNKYPPSLLYILMTLGVAITALALLEYKQNWLTDILSVYGKVPMFFYVLHIYLMHATQLLVTVLCGFSVETMLNFPFRGAPPSGWGFNLPVVYLVWIMVVATLYIPCRWYMRLKQREKKWWHSYI
ncbi:DUF1624 domain-containing protein [Chitinophaga sp. RAB17]|uniref:DUF1624 domain-containing protein n=1 Tax=Chitinophaga sp. RAB17 TaxID=3233049 RepID=UPI003F92B1AC